LKPPPGQTWDWLLSNPGGRVLPMTTRTIAIIALLIAAVVLVLLLT